MSKKVSRPTTLQEGWNAGYTLVRPDCGNCLQAIPGSLSEAELPYLVSADSNRVVLQGSGMVFYLRMVKYGFDGPEITVEVPSDLALLIHGAMVTSEADLIARFRNLLKINENS